MKKYYCILILVFLLVGCSNPSVEPRYYDANNTGILVQGDGYGGHTILNTHDSDTLTIRIVWQFRGETTDQIAILPPGGYIKYILGNQHAIYVYKESNLIGFLK